MKPKTLRCESHGASWWTGQVICMACGAVWHLNVENPPDAPSCTCGELLLKSNKGNARPICAECYRVKRQTQGAPS